MFKTILLNSMKKYILLLISSFIFIPAVLWYCWTPTSNAQYYSCTLFEKGYDAYNRWDYELSVSSYRQFLSSVPSDNIDYESARGNLVLGLNQILISAFQKKDWSKVISYWAEILTYTPQDVFVLKMLWLAYWSTNDIKNSIIYYQTAYNYATDSADIKDIQSVLATLRALEKDNENKKNAPSNDPLSYAQYYLKTLNIPAAWQKVTNSKEVVVAIIDDGISINHPDLIGKIWVNPTAKYGANKIIDFVGDKIAANLPTGEHGTMIAGIIGAIINNKEGIAGIAKNVKFMPLRVFGFDDSTSDDKIIRAMNYAIDNGANIINLSLWWSQFSTYSDWYDEVIKRAYDKGIIIVIAAGNGDVLTQSQIGVDLSINPISPVCNNNGKTKYSIGVESFDEEGYRTWWTNYNACTLFSAPGVNIVSTSIPLFNGVYGANYNKADWTSFSAPMITGIIALGYNQYGFVPPSIVQKSLQESLVKNGIGNYVIDAAKYLDILGSKQANILSAQKQDNSRALDRKTIDANSDANVLASFGIINQQDNEEAYMLNSNVLRQEVIGMAMRLGGFELPEDYKCKRIFKDVSQTKPNNWVCRAVEIGVENWIISNLNKSFNPEFNITRAEALAILLKAAGIKIDESSSISKYKDVTEPWQINLLNTAFSFSFIDEAENFFPNKNATRGEIFNMAKRILKSIN